MKIDKQRLRREAWQIGTVYWRPGKGQPLRVLDAADRDRLESLLTGPRAT
jgi:fatty-acyl-CoA synthase